MVAVTGTGSGLDIDGLVASLVAAEQVPAEARLNAREANITSLSTSFSSAKSAVSDFEAAANKLALASTFSQFTTSSSDTTKATISAASSASLGSYQLAVTNLASAQTLASGTFTATSDTLGTGTLTIALGTPSYSGSTYSSFSQTSSVDITIDSSNNTLAGVRDAINNANAGVNASILKNGDNYQLLLVSEETGLSKSMSISVTGDSVGGDTDNDGLSQLAFNNSGSQLTQYAVGANANFSINGLSVSSASNTVTDVIDGVTLNLLSATSSAITIDVKTDTDTIVADVQAFVDKYNAYASLFKDLTKYDATTGTAGALQGDSTARSVMSQIRSELGKSVAGLTGSYTSLADLGISIDKSGVMTFTQSTFKTAFAAAPTEVTGVLASTTVSGAAVEGVAEKLETLMEGFLVSTTGIFDSRISSLGTQLTAITDDRADLARRMQSLEDRYFAQLNAMDSLLAEIETTGNFLTQQFEAMKPRKD
ncbi:flagellar filament capping protein FliD [Luminiphilus sp.]|nr:flagellar filament capping protein FliD [Luminiphilus sp.]